MGAPVSLSPVAAAGRLLHLHDHRPGRRATRNERARPRIGRGGGANHASLGVLVFAVLLLYAQFYHFPLSPAARIVVSQK